MKTKKDKQTEIEINLIEFAKVVKKLHHDQIKAFNKVGATPLYAMVISATVMKYAARSIAEMIGEDENKLLYAMTQTVLNSDMPNIDEVYEEMEGDDNTIGS